MWTRRCTSLLLTGARARRFLAVAEADNAGAAGVPPSRSRTKTYFLETHGCQMNVSDSEVVRAILAAAGWTEVDSPAGARVLFTNTCSVREKAENKVRTRLSQWRAAGEGERKLGVLGCMASRLREQLTEVGAADLVAGPDSYRELPALLEALDAGATSAVQTQLSVEETYADIAPVRARRDLGSPSAFVTIMRGCNNMCTYCVVPFTRGRERSRRLCTVVDDVRRLVDSGVKEVTLLGQNVNSYWDRTTIVSAGATGVDSRTAGVPGGSAGAGEGVGVGMGTVVVGARAYQTSEGFGNVFKARDGAGARFGDLLEAVAAISPELRVRFTSPHPKDFPPDVLRLIGSTPNICSHLHLPLQSGSTSVLARMRREYTREAYLALVERARDLIPRMSLSTDIITGFCGETDAEHADTVDLMRAVGYDQAFMYAYSVRSKTHAARRLADDVPMATKQRRLREIIDVFHEVVTARNSRDQPGCAHVVLVEGPARKAPGAFTGRSDGNHRVVFSPAEGEPAPRPGEYVVVEISEATGHTLRGRMAEPSAVGGSSMREWDANGQPAQREDDRLAAAATALSAAALSRTLRTCTRAVDAWNILETERRRR